MKLLHRVIICKNKEKLLYTEYTCIICSILCKMGVSDYRIVRGNYYIQNNFFIENKRKTSALI